MPTVVLKRAEQILQALINKIVARTDLSDITDASSLKHLLAAVAREIDEVYFQLGLISDRFAISSAVGDDLDERALEIQPSLISRRSSLKATGAVVFSRSLTTGLVTIPTGTMVKTASGEEFSTTEDGTIADGDQDSSEVGIVAETAGTSGNVAAGTIIRFGSRPAGVDTVENTSALGNGVDRETDDEFRARIKAFIRTLPRNTPEALEFVAREVVLDTTGERVVYAHVFEDPEDRGEVTLYIDNGSGTTETVEVILAVPEIMTEGLAGPPAGSAVGGEEFLWLDNKPVKTQAAYVFTSSTRGVLVEDDDFVLNDASGQVFFPIALSAGEIITATYTAFTGLIEEVQKVIDGDPDDRVNYPGWRAAGVRVRVATPQILQQTVEGTLVIKEGFDSEDVIEDAQTEVAAYINGLGISGDVLRSRIIKAIMSVPGVYNVTLTEPAEDVIMNDDELPRVTAGDIDLS